MKKLLTGLAWVARIRWQFSVRRRLARVDWLGPHLPWAVWCRLCAWSADNVIEELARREPRPLSFVQVGANDGVAYDPLHESVRSHGWTGVLVEPMPQLFDRLVVNYRDVPGLHFANAAVAREAGTATMYTVERREGDPDWVDAIASLDREVVMRHAYALPRLEERVREVDVDALSFPDLLERYDLEGIDLLHTDAEGFDGEIIRQLDLGSGSGPRYLIFERKHMGQEDFGELASRLRQGGYRLVGLWPDQLAYRSV